MATKESTIEYILDQLSGVKDVRARKMFGEYAVYCQDKVVALVCDDELFVKITEPGKKFVGKQYQEGFPYPGAKAAMRIGGDLLEEPKWLSQLVSPCQRLSLTQQIAFCSKINFQYERSRR